jgi:hypothetical protein
VFTSPYESVPRSLAGGRWPSVPLMLWASYSRRDSCLTVLPVPRPVKHTASILHHVVKGVEPEFRNLSGGKYVFVRGRPLTAAAAQTSCLRVVRNSSLV